jgi:hypothetical protein
MSGIPEYNYPAFNAKAAELRAKGEEVINPAELDAEIGQDECWSTYLRRDLAILVQHCDKIVLLPGWEKSKGATLERLVGAKLGMAIVYPDGTVIKEDPAGQANLSKHREVFA